MRIKTHTVTSSSGGVMKGYVASIGRFHAGIGWVLRMGLAKPFHFNRFHCARFREVQISILRLRIGYQIKHTEQ